MNIEIPVFSGGSDRERIAELESALRSIAETLSLLPFEIEGFKRSERGQTYDEITLTYPDGSRVRYRLTKAEGQS